jgi:peptidoglycan/xylan/chitin deacetylase (PgdA/CDA1 family)
MMKAAMAGLYHSGAHRLLAPYTEGVGLIFTLHQVRPEADAARPFAPNRILEVTPDFLEAVLDQVRDAGLDVITLDEAAARLASGGGKRFVCFTFDDGYRDNFQYAYPMFKARGLPFTLYVPTNYPDGKGELWWLALEQAVREASDEIVVMRDGETWRLPTKTIADKEKSFEEIYWWLRALDEDAQRRAIRALAEAHDIDLAAQCRDLIMTWDELRTMATDPLVTLGAHTKDHFALAKLSETDAMGQMVGSADRIEQELGFRPAHFAYPYGDPGSAGPRDFALAQKAGFKTAVTTRKGMLFPGHAEHLTALPRVSLNGDYQSLTYTALYLSGAPFALWNGFQQVNAA